MDEGRGEAEKIDEGGFMGPNMEEIAQYLAKPKMWHSKKYREAVRKLPCCIGERCHGDVVAHHIESGGMRIKCDDFKTVPICHKHHDEVHRLGKATFQAEYGIDLAEEIWLAMREVIKLTFKED